MTTSRNRGPRWSYEAGGTPGTYKCSACGAGNCKLWRQWWHTFLLCRACAEKRTGATPNVEFKIGGYIPAIPDKSGRFGDASQLDDARRWWEALS